MNSSIVNHGTVLVVDRDPVALVLMQKLLASQDYRVLLAATSTAAVFLIRQHHIDIDVVLLDLRMRGGSRTVLEEQIRSIRPNVRVLWMSGFADGQFIRVKLAAGHGVHPPKSRCRAGVIEAVRQAMEAPKTMTAGG